jgi:hypothetical protein
MTNSALQRVLSNCSKYKRRSSSTVVLGRSSKNSFRDKISYSIDKMDSIPYTNWKGVNHVEDLTDAR